MQNEGTERRRLTGKTSALHIRQPTVPSYCYERQRQGREEHGDNDAEGRGYADPVGQRPEDEGGHQDGPSPADGEPRGGRVAVSRHRGDGRRDAQRIDAADAKPGHEQPGEGQYASRREPEERESHERQAERRGEE